jgi:hypothetical protein
MGRARTAWTLGTVAALGISLGAQQTQTQTQPPPPTPRPFPGATPPATTSAKPADPNAVPPAPQAPTPAELGAAMIYPNAEFLESYDLGRGQKMLLYGTNMAFDQIVTYYKAQRLSARELFREPPMQQFDIGRYDEKTMGQPPSIVVKDYTWNGSEGYLHVVGTTERRYRTIIQIVSAGR